MTCSESQFEFHRDCIQHWANKYKYREEEKVSRLVKKVQPQKYLTKSDLQIVGDWKSYRSAWHIDKNEKAFVIKVTQFALSTTCDRAAIESLTILDGVGMPTASVILHFFHERGDYPILDFRALWSVSMYKGQNYNYKYYEWSKYVKFCRDKAKKANVSMRVLDRALWQYSKCNQKRR